MSMGIAGRCGVERRRKERTKENQNYLDVNKLQVWREDFAEEAVQVGKQRLTGGYATERTALADHSCEELPTQGAYIIVWRAPNSK
jgi:hypothetical protein